MSDVAGTLRKAVAEHQAGRVAEAEKLYKRVLNSDPNNLQALRLLGVLASGVGRHDVAVQLVRKAIALKPTWADAWNDLGVAYMGMGDVAQAKGACEKAIALRPRFAGAKSNLAELMKQMGHTDVALSLWYEAAQIDPSLAEPHYNIGVLLMVQGRAAEAEAYFKKTIEMRPTYAPAYNNLGSVQWAQGRKNQAAEAFAKALELNPAYSAAWNNLGQVHEERGKTDEAMECFRKAIVHRPNNADAHCNLGLALDKKGDRAGAIREWEEALRLRPGWEEPQYYLAAAQATVTPTSAPASYVSKLFDDYADKFDEHLSGALEYRVPELLLKAVHKTGADRFEQVMDLGCGTGLVGQQFRSMATGMIGVDLSARMIEKARSRGIYDELHVGDVVEELKKRNADIDLILAGDLLIYLGELSPLFAAAAHAMRQGGIFAFSVEKFAGEGFELRPSRRFAHSPAYLQQVTSSAGLEIAHVRDEVLRTENLKPIEGMILVVRKVGG